MRKSILIAAVIGASLAGSANAQSYCDATELIAEYEHARDNDIPALDLLQTTEKTKLIGEYEMLVSIIDQQIVIESGNAAPRLRPDIAVSNLPNGGSDATEAAIALHVNNILSAMPAGKWLDYRNSIAAAIPALKGTSADTFGQVQDRINRTAMEGTLRRAGCPDDLLQDYGIQPYIP